MKKLIICEKPSLAQSVSRAINKMGEKPQMHKDLGYVESQNYIIVPSFGHLFTLCDVEEYRIDFDLTKKYSWTLDNLPCVPTNFQFALKKDNATKQTDKGIEKQFNIIKKLIHSKEVNEIIHCGDSDREGEIIIRIILDQAENKKPVSRLWLPDQVEETIIEALNNLIDDSQFDNLAKEGYARMFVDWIYGINLTRYASIKTDTLIRVGRVISTVVKTIYDREIEIKRFIPQKYFVASGRAETNGKSIEVTAKKQFNASEIESLKSLIQNYNDSECKVADIITKKKKIESPRLFSQSTLQNTLSKKFGYSPDKTLSLVQSLYERGFVSYPRTGTEYLATAEKSKVKDIIKAIGNNNLVFKDSERIFDDSKIESHSAITPTVKIPKDNDFKSDEERNCYSTILTRFNSVFYAEECNVEETIMKISVGDYETFEKKGTVIITKGFRVLEDINNNENTLPKLNIGDVINFNFVPLEKTTQPKKSHTVETLNNYLKNPFKKSDSIEMDDEDYKAMLKGLEIGTEATRSGIISTAINSKYIELNKSTYKILPMGEYLVETLTKLGIDISAEKTAHLGKALKDVYNNDITIDDAINITKNELVKIFESNIEITKVKREQKSIGLCPICGKTVVANSKAYSCEDRGCTFVIWKVIANNTISEIQASRLLKVGKTDLIKGFINKEGKPFSAFLVLKQDKTVAFEIPKKKYHK